MNRTSQGNTHTLKGYILHRSLSAPTLLFPPPHLHLPPLQEPETEENIIDPRLMLLLSYSHVWCCAWPQTATETMPQSHNPPKHNPSHSQTKESHPEAAGAHSRGWKSCPMPGSHQTGERCLHHFWHGLWGHVNPAQAALSRHLAQIYTQHCAHSREQSPECPKCSLNSEISLWEM